MQSFKLDQKEEWNRALEGSRIAVGNTDSVPVGIYAKEALTHLGVWVMLNPNWLRPITFVAR